MDKENLNEEFDKIWNQTPTPHSDEEKENSWKQFHSQTFAKKKSKFRPWRYCAAAAVLLFALIGTRIYYKDESSAKNSNLAVNVIENSTTKIKNIILPDSSKVELSPHSKIVYGSNFKNNRRIEIEGEAHFRVKKDKKHPFRVFCNETTTTVLGTSFTVIGQDTKGVIVQLYEGSVQMNVEGKTENWILKPGEKFTYGNEIANVSDFIRFTDFDNEKLIVVSKYIEERYGYKVIIPKENLNQKITIRINKKEDLKTIVQLIAEMYNLNFEINDEVKQITFQ